MFLALIQTRSRVFPCWFRFMRSLSFFQLTERRLLLFGVVKYAFEWFAEYRSDAKSGFQRWRIFSQFDRIHGLARDAEFVGEVGLRPVELGSQIAHGVFHSYLLFALPRPNPQSAISNGATQLTSKRGSPAFC